MRDRLVAVESNILLLEEEERVLDRVADLFRLLIDQEMKIRGLYSLEDRGGLGKMAGVDQLVADGRTLLGRGPD